MSYDFKCAGTDALEDLLKETPSEEFIKALLTEIEENGLMNSQFRFLLDVLNRRVANISSF